MPAALLTPPIHPVVDRAAIIELVDAYEDLAAAYALEDDPAIPAAEQRVAAARERLGITLDADGTSYTLT